MIAEGHRTASGYVMTARLRRSDGEPIVFTAEGDTDEEARDRLWAQLEEYLGKGDGNGKDKDG